MPTTRSRRSTRGRRRVSARNNATQRFENLPRSTQIRCLRRLAQSALTAYNLEQARITLLHHFLHARLFTTPEGFTRKRWDLQGLQGGALGIEPGRIRTHLSPDDCSVLDRVAERIGQTMNILGEGPELFGLIHADIHQWNYLFHKGNVHAYRRTRFRR